MACPMSSGGDWVVGGSTLRAATVTDDTAALAVCSPLFDGNSGVDRDPVAATEWQRPRVGDYGVVGGRDDGCDLCGSSPSWTSRRCKSAYNADRGQRVEGSCLGTTRPRSPWWSTPSSPTARERSGAGRGRGVPRRQGHQFGGRLIRGPDLLESEVLLSAALEKSARRRTTSCGTVAGQRHHPRSSACKNRGGSWEAAASPVHDQGGSVCGDADAWKRRPSGRPAVGAMRPRQPSTTRTISSGRASSTSSPRLRAGPAWPARLSRLHSTAGAVACSPSKTTAWPGDQRRSSRWSVGKGLACCRRRASRRRLEQR